MQATQAEPSAYFAALGAAVSQAWSAAGRRHSSLPDAAEKALTVVEVPEGLDAMGILGWAAGAPVLPAQSRPSDPFGQPPLILHREEDFFVQVLTWMDGTTAIHQHAFAGAFMVLQGASLHVPHSFVAAERLAEDRIVVGELSKLEPEVLRPFDVRRIDPGEEFIHALFHLERPTVTVVVRNESCGLPYPQYSYSAPGLGWDGLWEDRIFSKRLQSVDSIRRLDPAAARRTVEELVEHRPLWEAFQLLDYWCNRYGWDDVTAGLSDRLLGGPLLAPVLAPALAQEVQVRKILADTGMLHVFHQRLLLALLANLPDAVSVAAVLRKLFPGQAPGDLLLDWAEELSAPSLRGVSGLSLAPARLDEMRATPIDRREQEVLAEIRSAWGDPTSKRIHR